MIIFNRSFHQTQRGPRSLQDFRSPLEWHTPTMSVWCEPIEIMLTERAVPQLKITLRTVFCPSFWGVCWDPTINSCRKITRADAGAVFLVTRDPRTFMQGSPEGMFLCDHRERRVKHNWQRCFASFDAKLIRGYKCQLSLPGRPPPCTQASTTEESWCSWGMVQKNSTSRSRHAKKQLRFFFLFFCFFICLFVCFV